MADRAYRSLLVVPILICIALGGARDSVAQSAEVVPEELRRIPIGDLGAEEYWQQVAVTFAAADAPSDSTVRLIMPGNVEVRDSDNDGLIADEVRVMYDASGDEEPGFSVSESTVPAMIVVESSQAAAVGGRLYLQFPIRFGATTEVGELTYGSVLFDDPRETDLVPGPLLTTIDAEETDRAAINLTTFGNSFAPGADTTTSALGTVYPDVSEVVVTNLPDLVFDNGTQSSNNLLGFGDGDDSNDVEYRFFFSTSADLVAVDNTVAVEARLEDGSIYREREGTGRSVTLRTRNLPIGTQYLYVTSSVTGAVPVARSRALTVRHEPEVDFIGPTQTDLTLDSGGLLDASGRPTGRGTGVGSLNFAVTDHDDTSGVFLFYSADPDLGADGVLGGPANISGLTGAKPIASAQGVRLKQGPVAWDIGVPEIVEAGAYYIYAVATDASAFNVGRSSARVIVRHSPFLRLDVLNDRVLSGADTIVTGGASPQQFVTVTWGRSGWDGDRDVDDDAQISLYYTTMPATTRADAADSLTVPGGADGLRAALGSTVHRFAQGVSEDPDRRTDNLFAWDVWSTAVAGTPPSAGADYYIYGIIEDDISSLLVQLNGGRLNDAGARLRFEHPPSLRMLHPIADIEITDEGSARVSWEDMDVDDDARLRVMLSLEDHGEVADYAAVLSGSAFVVNSADGGAESDTTSSDLSEDDNDDFYDVSVSHIAGIQPDTSYYAYVAITETGRFDATTLACRAQGKVGVRSGVVDEDLAGPTVFELLPSVFTLGNGGRSQAFEIRVNGGDQPVDLVQLRLSLDGALFDVLDADDAEGTQPFQVGPDFSEARVFVNDSEVDGDGTLLLDFTYFDPISPRIEGLDGETAIATFQLVSRTEVGLAVLQLDADPLTGRISKLENDRALVASPLQREVARGLLVSSRGVLRGSLVLEGREDQSAVADMTLRSPGNYLAMEDSLWAQNDIDAEKPGVQVAVQPDGAFELLQVPAGRFDLNVHVDGFLDGWVPDVRLASAQELEGLRPSTTGAAADSVMLGGDVAGYFDTDGVSKPDNEITLSDWDFVAALFKKTIASDSDSARADITADGIVDISDLAMVGANFLDRGPRPVYKRSAGDRAEVELIPSRTISAAGELVDWEVWGRGITGVRAMELKLGFDSGQWEPVSTRAGQRNLFTAAAMGAGGLHLAGVARGGTPPLEAAEPLAVLRLRSRVHDPQDPTIETAVALDAGHRPVAVEFASTPATELPERFGLSQNYPNPFNPETTISFVVGSAYRGGVVKLEIFDVLGQLVDVVWEGPLLPGQYQATWDGRDRSGRRVASGVYLYRLQAEADLLIRRMVLVR